MKLLIIIIIFSFTLLAQTNQPDSVIIINIPLYSAEYSPLFPGQSLLEIPSLKINSKYFQFQNDPTNFFLTTYLADPAAQLDSTTLREIEFKELSKKLNSSMLMMYDIKHSKDPTLLRQVLGTMMTATTVGLAGYHVYKYYVKKEK
ncbi:MAG: hypothetical protein WC900_10315 [Oscillospiraceae bacterium]|jgi:hypothetical protein